MSQLLNWHLVLNVENDASVSAELELTSVHFFEGVHQRGLAVKEHGVLTFLRFYLIDSDQTATLGLRGEVTGLTPLQGFFQLANTVCS